LAWDEFWDPLLDLIENGLVVPVVSKDLLVTAGGELLYRLLARGLADRLRVKWTDELAKGAELNNVACRYLQENRQNAVPKVHSALYGAVEAASKLMTPPPAPLLQLADIGAFRLFITTTFESCLEKAINQVRFRGQAKTRILSYSPSKRDERSVPILVPGTPTVYHLLGKMSVLPQYAVTQWEIVEYFHALQSQLRPNLLFDELRNRSLLILGNSFDGWLARFFLRLAKEGSEATADYIADPLVNSDDSLVLFISRFTRRVEVYSGSGGAIEFVDELHRRWRERHPEETLQIEPPGDALEPIGDALEPNPIFLSYASEDLAAAAVLAEAIEANRLPVFFDQSDRQGLQLGEDWNFEIRKRISTCSFFMPLISKRALAEGDRYVKVEWNAAIQRAGYRYQHEKFILPVIIDETDPENDAIPEAFRSKQSVRLPGGVPTQQFLDRVRDLYRKFRKMAVAGAS
jgi:hypothetical protein